MHALCWSRYVEYDHVLEFCNARADGSIADYEICITNGHDNPNCEQDFSSFNTCLNDQCGQYEDTKYNSETKEDTNFLMISVHKKGMPLSRPKMIDLTQNDVQAYEAEVKKLALLLSLPINQIAASVESANDETQDDAKDWDNLSWAISSIDCDSEQLDQTEIIFTSEISAKANWGSYGFGQPNNWRSW